jgi:hypothetical protein
MNKTRQGTLCEQVAKAVGTGHKNKVTPCYGIKK